MDCLIHLMALCLFDPSGVYVTGEITPFKQRTNYERDWEVYVCSDHLCEGPLATLKVGVMLPMSENWVLDYGYKHTSFPMEPHDHGQNTPFISLTWRPFR